MEYPTQQRRRRFRDQPSDKLKLGKGAYFVKSQLRRLSQEDEVWEADFIPVPPQGVWIGLVIDQNHDFVLAQTTVEEPPTVNDLADLLAAAMRRPLVQSSHRPRTLLLRDRPEWAELLPHLMHVGIDAVSLERLPKWDAAFAELYALMEANGPTREVGGKRAASKSRKEPPMARKGKSAVKLHKPVEKGPVEKDNAQLFTLEVRLISGMVDERFAKKNPVISRTIQIRGDQTLADLHHAIFEAYGRWDEHVYEFQFGKGPMDPQGPMYTLQIPFGMDMGVEPAGWVDQTAIDSLHLEVGRSFFYWFDFGDDWWHRIDVMAVEENIPRGKYPKVTKKVGQNPPQYPEE